jgi:threonine synthase
VSDTEIRERIKEDAGTLHHVWCPHTATAAEVYRRIASGRPSAEQWVLVSTAHPAKFNDIVEPLIGHEVPVPPALERLLTLPRREQEIAPTLAALRASLLEERAA